MKRLLASFITMLMLLSMMSTVALAAEPMVLEVTPRNGVVEYERGQNVILTVAMKKYSGVALLGIQGEYDSSILTKATAIKADFGTQSSFNATNLYTGWVFASNNVVYDEDYNEATEFDLINYRFTVAADAPFGETTVKIKFATKDVNGNTSNAYLDDQNKIVIMEPGVHYSTEEASVTIKIVCNHDFTGVEYTKPAEGTAMSEAEHSRVCTKCSQTIPETCEFDAVVTDPGHTTTGYTTHTCACGYVVVDTETEATGHEWGKYVHDDELTENKHTHTRTCVANDGGSETEDCDFSTQYNDPTCTEDGYVTYTCEVCNYSYNVTDEGSAKGHDLKEYTYLAEVEGVHTHIAGCADCDYDEEVPCTMGAWSVTDVPTRTETGLKSRTCIYCGIGTETEVLPKQAYFTVSDAEGVCGHEMEVTVSITNNPGLSGIVFDLAFDDTQMTLVSAEIGALGANVPLTIQPANKDGDVYKIALATPAGIDGDGELLKLKFKVADTVTEGDYDITVSTTDACDSSEAMVDFTVESDVGVADLRNYTLGDINRDGIVSVADAVILARYLADMDVTIEPYAAELVTDDGDITTADVQFLLGYLIGKNTL